MPKNQDNNTKSVKCSFCGKPQGMVRKIIAGPGVFICDECVTLCQDIIEEEKNPDAKVRLGIKALNQMFDGGLEKGRVYCMFAVAKGWKSGFLLTSAIQAKKLNKFTTKPGLKPVVVYLTMENSIKETVKRIWNHAFGDGSNISDFDKVTAAGELERAGIFTPNDPNAAELLLWYRPNKSISTTELHGMLEDLEKEGYLVKVVPHKHNVGQCLKIWKKKASTVFCWFLITLKESVLLK